MNSRESLQRMVVSGLLIAIGIIIPMFSPVKIMIEPASYTLASHVPIFLAMMISPMTAVFVSLGTTIGFALAGFPIVIVIRAFTHIGFAFLGATYISRRENFLSSGIKRLTLFSFLVGVIHAACESVAVAAFYILGMASKASYEHGFLWSVLVLVGLGGIVHSMIDFQIAHFIYQPLKKNATFKGIFK